jgi:hypothetical protein
MAQFESLSATVSIGNARFESLFNSTSVGNARFESLKAEFMWMPKGIESESVQVKAGHVFIDWTYDSAHKRAVGTLISPLYHSAQFKLLATDGLKNLRAKKIKNPQESNYITA